MNCKERGKKKRKKDEVKPGGSQLFEDFLSGHLAVAVEARIEVAAVGPQVSVSEPAQPLQRRIKSELFGGTRK